MKKFIFIQMYMHTKACIISSMKECIGKDSMPNLHMVKWQEMVVERSFISMFHFQSEYIS